MFKPPIVLLAILFTVGTPFFMTDRVTAGDSSHHQKLLGHENVPPPVRTPVAATHMETPESTVTRPPLETPLYESRQRILVPVTEYHWQPRWHTPLNPFRPPTVSYHLVPQTRWEIRTQTSQTPAPHIRWVRKSSPSNLH